jgi:hypothetical protein
MESLYFRWANSYTIFFIEISEIDSGLKYFISPFDSGQGVNTGRRADHRAESGCETAQ